MFRKKKLSGALAAAHEAVKGRLVAAAADRQNARWLSDNGANFRKLCLEVVAMAGYTPERIAEIWRQKAAERNVAPQRIGESNLAFRGRVLGHTELQLQLCLEQEHHQHVAGGAKPLTTEQTLDIALRWGMILG